MGFSWSEGLVAELCEVAEQAERGSGLSSMHSDVWFVERVGPAAEGESGFGRSMLPAVLFATMDRLRRPIGSRAHVAIPVMAFCDLIT